MKYKLNKGEKIINIGPEVSEIQNKNGRGIREPKSWFSEKINKIYKLQRLMREKQEDTDDQNPGDR